MECEIDLNKNAVTKLSTVIRKELERASGRNPGIIAIWDDEKARRRTRSGSSVIELSSSAGERNDKITNKEEERLKVRLCVDFVSY